MEDPYQKYSYLKLVRAVAKAESGGEKLFKLWKETSKDPEVQRMASDIEVREAAHYIMFKKRVQDLTGVDPYPNGADGDPKTMAIVGDPGMSDKEKFEKLGLLEPPKNGEEDVFSAMMDDKNLDNQTAELIGWFIADERVSARERAETYRKITGQPPLPAPEGKSPYETIAHLKRFRFLAKAEAGGERFYKAWADTCKDPELIPCLRRVEMREREHSIAFRKRVQELSGADPYPEGVPPQKEDDGRVAIALDPNMSDKEKFEKLNGGKSPMAPGIGKDVFSPMFTEEKDHDIASGILLARFIAEERASQREGADAYQKLVARSKM